MAEKLSLLVSTVIAALGWLVTHYVDRLTETPTVEYSFRTVSCDPAWLFQPESCHYRFEISNLSRTKAFETINLIFFKRGVEFRSFAFYPREPGHEGDDAPDVRKTSATFKVSRLMPGATMVVDLRATGGRPILHIQSGDTIRLSPPSLETRLVRHEMSIMLGLILFWLGLLTVIALTPLIRGRSFSLWTGREETVQPLSTD